MPPELVVPPAIEAIIQDFDRRSKPFTEIDVKQAVLAARQSLQQPTEGENLGAWAEVLAFALVSNRTGTSPWRTYFSHGASGTDQDGNTHYYPDIAGTPAAVIDHWAARAKSTVHPVLKARYADLAWEMCIVMAQARRDVEMARLAIDAYLASTPPEFRAGALDRFLAALRALDVASLISDQTRIQRGRASLLQLHQEVMAAKRGPWWLAFDRLIDDKRAGVTDQERQQLVSDLEELLLHYGDNSNPATFDPHAVERLAERLIRHYARQRSPENIKRVHVGVASAFEHLAGLGDALLASAVLQTAVNAYRDAGMPEESRRVRILMQEKIGQSRSQMRRVKTEIKVSRADMDEFLRAVVSNDVVSTFVNIAGQFLPSESDLKKRVRQTLEETPLMGRIQHTIMTDDHVAARVGSVEDDPFGRVFLESTLNFAVSAVWLDQALQKAIEAHDLVPEHFVAWANRDALFDDVTFLLDGVRAWYHGDLAKAIHVLVPQVERGLRAIVGKLGGSVTKAHPKVPNVSMAVGMAESLYMPEVAKALGPDLTLYFLALYADPRGYNLRNHVAHGLIKTESVTGDLLQLVIHTLLVFGIWPQLAANRR
jgi:lysyl-tRNA synthetase class 1